MYCEEAYTKHINKQIASSTPPFLSYTNVWQIITQQIASGRYQSCLFYVYIANKQDIKKKFFDIINGISSLKIIIFMG